MIKHKAPTSIRASMGALKRAAQDRSPIQGLTHCFYRYPARFSPTFAGAAIEEFSRPGDVVLDPFMGGGTTIVEAVVRGRQAIGNDLNSLAVFVARVKTTCLNHAEREALLRWAEEVVPSLNYRSGLRQPERVICRRRTYNLSLPIARPIKKIIALALEQLSVLPTNHSRAFARCALLNVGQLALNGRKRATPLCEFRQLLQRVIHKMLAGIGDFQDRLSVVPGATQPVTFLSANAADLPEQMPFSRRLRADLIVTSPPYPGIHILYHRWQIDAKFKTSSLSAIAA